MKKIGWFTTARGPGSFNLFNTMIGRLESGDIHAELAFVFINRDVKGNKCRQKMIDMAEERGVPVIILPSDTFLPELRERDIDAWRDEYGKGLRGRISEHRLDFGVLAGYMLIIDPETCRRFPLINLHPALPGTYKGTWEEIVQKVVENRDERYGSTVHLCTPELDRGSAIAYDSFPTGRVTSPSMDREAAAKAIRAEELRREAYLLMETIKLIVEGKVVIRGGRVTDQGGEMLQAPCLERDIDRWLSS